MKTENLQVLTQYFFNEDLILFDKEIKVFSSKETTEGKNIRK